MITIRGKVEKTEAKVDAGGSYVLFTLQPPQGQSVPVVWRGLVAVSPGDQVEAAGDLDHEGYLLAASVQKFTPAAPPVEKPKLYIGRAIGSALLGDLLGLILTLILVHKVEMPILVVLGIAFSALLAWAFAPKNRAGNAALGGVMAVAVPLVSYVLIKLATKK